jgi:hypothetical protein
MASLRRFHQDTVPARIAPTRRGQGAWLVCAAVLVLPGCTVDRYRNAAGQFGELTAVTTADQTARLNAIVAAEEDRYRQSLADERASLRLMDCAALLAGPDEGMPAPNCRLVRLGADGKVQDLPPKVELSSILALSDALNGYAQGLVVLASDTSADNQRFADSVGALATSLGGLDGAIRKVRGKAPAASDAKLSAVAGVVAQLGNLYLNGKRAAAIKRIILAGDPLVQEAVRLLAASDDQVALYEGAGLYDALRQAQQNAEAALATGDPVTIRAAQDRLFDALAAYRGSALDIRRFQAVGSAHARLVEAARQGASLKELQAALESLLALASAVQETTTAFGADAQGER